MKGIKKHGARKTITTAAFFSLSGSNNFYDSKNYKLKKAGEMLEKNDLTKSDYYFYKIVV